jgi:hypothetical protein
LRWEVSRDSPWATKLAVWELRGHALARGVPENRNTPQALMQTTLTTGGRGVAIQKPKVANLAAISRYFLAGELT